MIAEGLKLMVLGMGIVYVFLILLMVMVIISARVFKGHAVSASPSASSARRADDDIIAVLSAAIAAYRNKNAKK